MKKSQITKLKNTCKTLLIIVLGAFVVVPLILMIFNRSPKTYEGMYSGVTAPTYSFEFRNDTTTNDISDSISGEIVASPQGGATSDSSGMNFDGTSAYVDVGEISLGGGPMTFEFYAQWNSLNSWSRIMDFGSGEANNNIIIANDSDTDTFAFSIYDGGALGNDIKASSVTVNSLDHWVITWDDSDIKTYKNNVVIDTIGASSYLTTRTTTNNYLGKSNWSTNGYFDGSIAYVRIWNGTALTISDVNNLFAEKDT